MVNGQCDFVVWGATHIQFSITLIPWSNKDFSGFCTLHVQIRSKYGNVTNLAWFCLINLTIMSSSTFKAFVTWMQKCRLLRSIMENILSVTHQVNWMNHSMHIFRYGRLTHDLCEFQIVRAVNFCYYFKYIFFMPPGLIMFFILCNNSSLLPLIWIIHIC